MKRISKKAQLIGESVSLLVVTIIVVSLLIVFFVMIKGFDKSSPNIEKVNSLLFKNSAMISLEAYLNTPVKIIFDEISKEMRMVDLIRLSKINESYKKTLEEESMEIFDKVYGKNNYRLIIPDVLSIGRIEFISSISNPEIFIEKPVESYTDEEVYNLELPDMKITLAIKTK